MRSILHTFLITCGLSLFLVACDKADALKVHENGSAVTLSSSSATLAPPPADSNKVALTLNWTDPKYATAMSNYKFIIEMDSTGKNFSKPDVKTVTGALTTSFLAKELNAFLVARGYAFNAPVDMDVRVTSSYANNNEKYTSNVLKIRMTPYKVPPKVVLPAGGRLFIVGDATTFSWSNDPTPPFPPEREFARIDETTWGGVFYMNGSGGYKILQTQGDWNSQFHMVSGGTATAGSFVQENADPTFPSPTPAGWYKIMLDFQSGKYTVTSFGSNALPQQLYITGDATGSNWTENPPASQRFTRVNSAEYEISIAFTSGKFYKFLSTLGQWQPQFGGSSATGGALGANWGGGTDPAAVPTPAAAGTYKVRVNFFNDTYKVYQ